MLGLTTTSDPGTSGMKDISEALGGGINEGSLVLIEGETKTGKSVLSQHIAYGVLHSKDSAVAYYSDEYNTESLVSQMESMALGTRQDLVTDRFRIYRMGSKNVLRDAEKSLKLRVKHSMELPGRFKLVIVDSASPFMNRVSPVVKVDFLQACKELCERDLSIVLALDSHIFENKSLYRAYAMSDYYLKLKSKDVILDTGQIDTRVIKMLEVTKLAGAERPPQGGIEFEIKPKMGIQLLPFVQIKI